MIIKSCAIIESELVMTNEGGRLRAAAFAFSMKLISWNIAQREAAWQFLSSADLDVALVQEAKEPPMDLAERFVRFHPGAREGQNERCDDSALRCEHWPDGISGNDSVRGFPKCVANRLYSDMMAQQSKQQSVTLIRRA
jgi:hypothetical protein